MKLSGVCAAPAFGDISGQRHHRREIRQIRRHDERIASFGKIAEFANVLFCNA